MIVELCKFFEESTRELWSSPIRIGIVILLLVAWVYLFLATNKHTKEIENQNKQHGK